MRNRFPYVSVVVPTYNRADCIVKCLNSLLRVDYPRERLEIIVVDDASTDETPRILGEYQRKGIIVIRHDRNTGPPGARNSGIAKAHGGIVAFVDSDCTVSKNWLRELVKPYKDPEVAGVGGAVVAEGGRPIRSMADSLSVAAENYGKVSLYTRYNHARIWKQATFLGHLQSKIFHQKPPESDGEIAFYAYHGTGNMSYRKSVLFDVGGFDETLHTGEDFSLKTEVARRGYKTVYAKSAVVWHPFERRSFKDFLLRDCIRKGVGRAAIINKYRGQVIRWLFSERKIMILVPIGALMVVVLLFARIFDPSRVLLVLLGGATMYELIEAARLAQSAKNLLLTPAFLVLDCLRKMMLSVGFVKGIILLLTRSAKKAKLTRFRKGLPSARAHQK